MPLVPAALAAPAPAPASPAPSSADPHEDRGSVPEGASPGWVSRVQREIREREYHVTWQSRTHLGDLPEAWHAPNRAHNFRTYFTDSGIRVIPRTDERPSWEWGLALAGYGRDGDVRPAEKGILTPEENQIEYDRGAIVEWYENTPRGLKQGFTLAAPPDEAGAASRDGNMTQMPGRARDGAIFLNLQLTGTLSPKISADG
jgi:hypothetical protein